MEVILLENIKNLGKIGDAVKVKRGYARNFLIKYGKALKASKEKQKAIYEKIQNELDKSKKAFQKYQWPIIDVTRKSVEETAAPIIKIYEIYTNKK